MKKIMCLLGLIASLPAFAFAFELNAKDKDFFMEESSAPYGEEVKKLKVPEDIKNNRELSGEDVLYSALKLTKTTSDGIKLFSSYFNIDEKMTDIFIRGIIDSVKIHEYCNAYENNKKCSSVKYDENTYQIIAAKPGANAMLFDIANNLHDSKYKNNIMQLIGNNKTLLLKIFDYNHDFSLLEPLINGMTTDTDTLIEIENTMDYESYSWDKLALGKFILKKEDGKEFPGIERIQSRLIYNLFLNGLTTEAFALYEKVTNGSLSNYLKKNPNNIFNCFRCLNISDSIAAYYITNNKKSLAIEALMIPPNRNMLVKSGGIEPIGPINLFLQEYIDRKLSRDEVYYYFIDGHGKGTKSEKSRDIGELQGWLGAIQESGEVIENLAIKYLTDHKYPEMIRYIKSKKRYSSAHVFPLTEKLGAQYQQLQISYKTQIEANNVAQGKEIISTDRENEPYKIISKFEERKLDKKYIAAKPLKPATKNMVTPIPVSEYQVKRIEKFEGEWYAVYTSGAVDPTGEVSAGGYWLQKTSQHGLVWDTPLYLGLQEYYPYEVATKSAMPMVSKDGLNLEVEIKEIDERSITFPPVGIALKRQEKNLYLHFNWNDLTQDSDNDGITDILETKIGTNPFDEDTDKDGFIDSTDTLPLTKYDVQSEKFAPVAKLLLSKIAGIDERAITVGVGNSSNNIMEAAAKTPVKPEGLVGKPNIIDPQKTLFLTGDISLFKGLDIPFRLIFIEDAPNLPRTGFFLPLDIGWIFSNADKTEFHVIWSAGWTGGSFKLHLNNGKYDIEELSNWITRRMSTDSTTSG